MWLNFMCDFYQNLDFKLNFRQFSSYILTYCLLFQLLLQVCDNLKKVYVNKSKWEHFMGIFPGATAKWRLLWKHPAVISMRVQV